MHDDRSDKHSLGPGKDRQFRRLVGNIPFTTAVCIPPLIVECVIPPDMTEVERNRDGAWENSSTSEFRELLFITGGPLPCPATLRSLAWEEINILRNSWDFEVQVRRMEPVRLPDESLALAVSFIASSFLDGTILKHAFMKKASGKWVSMEFRACAVGRELPVLELTAKWDRFLETFTVLPEIPTGDEE